MEQRTEDQPGPNLAKISRPRLGRCYPRQRLFDALDQESQKGLVWICAPAGSGKTTALGSYLKMRREKYLWYQIDARDADPAAFFYYLREAARRISRLQNEPLPLLTREYLLGLPVFTRNFFEQLYSRVKPPFILVFDNFQDLPEESLLQRLLAEAWDIIPTGVTVFILSRTPPPEDLAGLRARQALGYLDGSVLRFLPEEIRGIAELQNRRLSQPALAQLFRTTQGWAAGIILMLEAAVDPDESMDFGATEPEIIFDYFATEIFQRAESELQAFMLSTALLPQFSPAMAQALTRRTDAAQILQKLARRNYFTVPLPGKTTSYRYHPLFRRYLQALAQKQLTSAQIQRLKKKAALILIADGDLENAVPLLVDSRAWKEFADAVQKIGPLLMAQGRHLTLQGWLQAVPRHSRRNYPWLIYWLATSRMPTDQEKSRDNFIEALDLFSAKQLVDGIFLSWAGIVDTIVHQLADIKQLDQWMEKFDALLAQHGGQLSPQLETRISPSVFAAMVFRLPQRKDLPYWRERVTLLFETGTDPSLRVLSGFYLLSYYLWLGDRSQVARLVDILAAEASTRGASPLTRITGRLGEAWYGWATGNHDACRAAVEEGIALAGQSGVHVWTYILKIEACVSALITGNTRQAAELLEALTRSLDLARPLDQLYYYHDCAWRALLRNDPVKAYGYQSRALAIAEALGAVYCEAEAHYGMFQVCHARGEFPAAHMHIREARRLGEQFGSGTIAFQCDMAEAQYYLSQERMEQGLAALRSALRQVRKNGLVAFSWWRRDVMSRLCATALRREIEPDSARRMIREHRLEPDPAEDIPESWPWPVKVGTMGAFWVQVDGRRLSFTGKAQKKPLELLQAVMAMGGEEVEEARIVDALWPESEGDLAMQSLRTTVSRLRRLLGHEKALTTGNGKIGLDRRYVWIDIRAFERRLAHCIEAVTDKDNPRTAADMQKVLTAYEGEFLPHCNGSWAIPMRERLRTRYLNAVMEIGVRLEQAGENESAIECYRRGLEVDELVEGLYQGLIACYGKLGRGAEALRVYNQCEQIFQRELGIQPSSRTGAILRRYVHLPEP